MNAKHMLGQAATIVSKISIVKSVLIHEYTINIPKKNINTEKI